MIESLLISIVLILIFTPIMIFFTHKFKLYDHPNHRRINTIAMPTAGGLGIFAAFFITAQILGFDNLFPYFIGGLIVLITGLIDDARGLSAGFKFLGQAVAVTVFLILSPSPNYFFSALWMLGAINVINFIDGLDGLSTGIILIASLALFVWTTILGLPQASLVLILLGTTIGFLAFNFNPAKIFLGDTGAMFLGFLFSGLANNSVLNENIWLNLPLLILILAVPVMDAFCAIIRRLQKGVPVYEADCQHFHHRLLDLGLGQKRVALCGYFLTIASASTALCLVKLSSWNQFFILPVIAGAFLWGAGKLGMIKPFVVKSQRRVL